MWPGQRLDLDHATDENGVRTGGYVPGGLSHAACNQRDNAYNWRKRKAAADAVRSPQRQVEKDARDARRQRRQFRSEFDAAQGDG
jgi:hypothetical protein